jgi:hypothetical protein
MLNGEFSMLNGECNGPEVDSTLNIQHSTFNISS